MNEDARLAALQRLEVLDTPTEAVFDEITSLAADLIDAPMAIISLVDSDRQWFKSCVGLDATETPRSQAFCSHAILQNEPLIIEDASVDPRTRDNPMVTGEMGIRFYVGVPLILSSGEAVGTICAKDTRPRSLTERQVAQLKHLAKISVQALEQRLSKKQLAMTDLKLRSVQDATPVGVLHLRAIRDHRTRITDFSILDANQTAAKLARIPHEMATSGSLLAMFPGFESSGLIECLATVVSSRDFGGMEVEYRDHRWEGMLRCQAVRLGDGVVLTIDDVTDLTLVAQRLASSEGLMRQFVKHTPAAVAMFDTEMRYLVAAERWKHDYGLIGEDLDGRCHYDVFPEIGDEWKRLHQRVLRGESITNDRDRFERADGSVQWIRYSLYPWRDEFDTIGGMVMFTEDITSRVEQEMVIERGTALLEQTELVSGVGGWLLDVEKQELFWTPQIYKMHEVDPGFMPTVERAIDFYTEESKPIIAELVRRGMEEAEGWDTELEILTARGNVVPVRAVGRPIVEDGRVVRIVGSFQDMTEIRLRNERENSARVMLEAMSESSHDMIFVKDLQGKFLFVNPAFARFCGKSEAELIGMCDSDVFHPELADICRQGDSEAVDSGQAVLLDETVEMPNGETMYFSTAKSPYVSATGEVVGVIAVSRDLTESKNQEAERLRLSEMIKAITDASMDHIFVKDRNGVLQFSNPAHASALGLNPQEIVGLCEYDLYEAGVAQELLEQDRRVIETEQPIEVEKHVRLVSSGEMRTYLTAKHPYRMPDGTVAGVLGVSRDVTEYRQALDTIETSEARLGFALSAAHVGYWDHDLQTDEVFYGDTWYTMLGYEPGELPMASETFWNDLIHPDDHDRVKRSHDECRTEGAKAYHEEVRVRCKDGSWKWITDIGSVIERDEDGTPTRMVGVHVDIDDQKRSQERLETALVAAKEGLWEWNIGESTCYYDDQWYRVLGYEPGELPMTFGTWESLCHPDDYDDAMEALAAYLSGRTDTYACEHRLKTKSAGWKWVLGTGGITERDDDGNPMRLVGVIMDIDERRLAADQLACAFAEAESANAAKSQFLANMSHEIRTPMTAILGYADLMSNDPEVGNDPFRFREAAGVIQRNGEHLLAIINDILDISKIEAGKMLIEAVEYNPLMILAEVRDMMGARAAGKGIRFGLEQRSALPETVRGDPVRFRQITMNLVSNAIKFTEEGEVTVAVKADRETGRLSVSVTDTGIGITDEQAASLFVPFQQADQSMTRRFGGTGLGLSISQRLAGLMNGEITIESAPRRGSTFTLDIGIETPEDTRWIELENEESETLVVQKTACLRAEEFPPDQLMGVSILLAEDGPDNQRLITHLLKRSGASVTVAGNGQEAVHSIESAAEAGAPFDLVLMDMQMPVMDGYTATTELRTRGIRTPIIAVTAHAMESDRARCLAAGCDDFETKPISRASLIATCARWAGLRAA